MTQAILRQILTSLLAIGLVLASHGAFAHAQFQDSSPAADTELDSSPHEIVLNFSRAVTPVTVTLVGPDGSTVDTGTDARGNGERVVLAIPIRLPSGAYVVSFRVLSGDAHPISGGFRFAIASPDTADDAGPKPEQAQPKPGPTESQGEATVPPNPQSSSLELAEQAVRAAFIALLMLGVGLAIFQALIPLPESLHDWLSGLVRRVGWIGIVAAVGYFLAATFSVTGVDAFRPRHLYVVLQTSIGMSLLVAMIGFLFLTLSAAPQRILVGIGAALLVVSRVITGHPASQEPMLLLIPSMAIHVATAGFWFASLWVLLRLLRKGPLADAPQILERFAKAALWSVSALLAVGALMAAIHIKSIDGLLNTEYGNILLWKLGGVAGLLVFALVNKFWLTPQLVDQYDPGKLKNSIRLEAVVMLVIIVISTVLAATPPNAVGEGRLVQSQRQSCPWSVKRATTPWLSIFPVSAHPCHRFRSRAIRI